MTNKLFLRNSVIYILTRPITNALTFFLFEFITLTVRVPVIVKLALFGTPCNTGGFVAFRNNSMSIFGNIFVELHEIYIENKLRCKNDIIMMRIDRKYYDTRDL